MAGINPQIFRQYDTRGVAERDLTDETVELLGKSFGTYVRGAGSNKVLVGRDNRLSSLRLRDAITILSRYSGVSAIIEICQAI